VRSLVDVQGGAPVTGLNPEQLTAVEETGAVFVSAGAGTGKTAVIVERFVKAVAERGLPVDGVVVVTYTERAAGELRARIRARLAELERHELAREIDGAWISTIHGFCARLLRLHPFEAGIDPRFTVLDESQAAVLRSEAFVAALANFCKDREPARLRLLATYGTDGLSRMIQGVHARLRSAGLPLELRGEARGELAGALGRVRLAADAAAREAGSPAEEAAVRRALELLEPPPPAERLLDLTELRVGRRGDQRLAGWNEALADVEAAALDEVASRDRALLEELLRAFDRAYAEAKARESALDFEDLQLRTRDLLRGSEAVRAGLRWRIRALMVDEFQDTNRLQCELIDRLEPEDLFFVGDEFQSIYRFRHADVDVFRERRASSAGVLALTQNYRSRPEVLEVVNAVFGAEFGEGFEPLTAAGRFPDPAFGPAVELLVTDKEAYRAGDVHWRVGEARHVARRIRELVDAGECEPGECVLLFAAGTDAERYEEALRAEGLPTYRAAGRGYFGQQQVFDLVAYLRLLHNRYDDEALVTVLASPLVGVSNDALVLLRRAAGRRPLFSGLERELPAGLGSRDVRLFEAFKQRYGRLVRISQSVGLERLCDRIVVEHDYDLAVLARWDGRRRWANVRKLARLARSYEDLRGPDVEGFVRFLRSQEAAGAREVEAVAEEEGADAVRLLTIHAAKGLEFKVVVVADAGRASPSPDPDEILCLPDGRFGFRVVDPATGKRKSAFAYEEARHAERTAQAAESRRLLYVAMTRAVDRLIVSGAVDTSARRDERTHIRWLLERLAIDIEADGPVEVGRDGAGVLVRVDRGEDAAAPTGEATAAEQLELFAPGDEGSGPAAPELPELATPPVPPPFRLRRLSYSSLALFERCSYRFYAERIVGLSPRDGGLARGAAGLDPAEIGDAVHVALEQGWPVDEARELALALYPGAGEDDLARIEALVAAWRGSALAARLASLEGIRRELPFAFEHDGVLVHGRFDAFVRTGGRVLVVDYKTNRLEGAAPADILDAEYGLQRLVYALAALRAGASEVEVAYAFLERPDEPAVSTYSQADRPALEAALSDAVAAIAGGDFRPTPDELVCGDCPALDVVCAGPRLAGVPLRLAAPAGAA
jgi:ATP-dependent exoDNAse (exonuclease V) beta subunit